MRIMWKLICLTILVKCVVVINTITDEPFHGLHNIITAHISVWFPKMNPCVSFKITIYV